MRNFVNGTASLALSSASHKLEPSITVDERLFTAQEVAECLGVGSRTTAVLVGWKAPADKLGLKGRNIGGLLAQAQDAEGQNPI